MRKIFFGQGVGVEYFWVGWCFSAALFYLFEWREGDDNGYAFLAVVAVVMGILFRLAARDSLKYIIDLKSKRVVLYSQSTVSPSISDTDDGFTLTASEVEVVTGNILTAAREIDQSKPWSVKLVVEQDA